MDDTVGQLILIAVLTAVNGFFAAAEMAMVSVNKTVIETLAKINRNEYSQGFGKDF